MFNDDFENDCHFTLHSSFYINIKRSTDSRSSQRYVEIALIYSWENCFPRKKSSAFTVDEFQLDDNFSNDDEVEFLLDDMILSREQMDELFQPTTRKNGVKNLENLWPNKTIPFLISQKFSK